MKKILLLVMTVFVGSFAGILCQKSFAMPNPWIDCGDDISCGAGKAGFNMPLRVNKYNVRAMHDMLEITFPLDKKRTVALRKSTGYYGEETSGVYVDYPFMRTIKLNSGTVLNVRGDKKRYYVATFAADSGYYSLYCEKGMNLDDINYLYGLIAEADGERRDIEGGTSYSLEELRRERTVKGVLKPVYTKYDLPTPLKKRGVTNNCFERANLGDDSACSASEVIMIKDYYKKSSKR